MIFWSLFLAFISLLWPSPAQAATNDAIIIPYTAPYQLAVADFGHIDPDCRGSLWMETAEKKEKKLITDALFSTDYPVFDLGDLAKNQEIILSVQTNCADDLLVSTNPQQTQVSTLDAAYVVEWEDGLFTTIITPKAPPYHPVIFVHGLGGHWTDWEEGGNKDIYFKTLKAEPYNYPAEVLYAYHYSDADGNPETYDNQGDVVKIAQGLSKGENGEPGLVDKMADLYYTGCQVDCVDLVGFSLGGIVIRQYLNEHPDDHKVRKAITIASPHEGSFWMGWYQSINTIPFIGQKLQESLRDAFYEVFNFWLNKGQEPPLDPENPAPQQLAPQSTFLLGLNKLGASPQDIDYNVLYGDIDFLLHQKIFFLDVSRKMSLGDGVMTAQSATAIPVNDVMKRGFTDPSVFDVTINLAKSDDEFEYSLDVLGLADTKYWHGNLINQPEVVEEVMNILTD
jgi:pimeloyl-ACP methyl ester carboxylesterase